MATFQVTTHAYTNDPSNYKQLDLYIPHDGTPGAPLLVFIHGGAWRSEDKADHRPLAEALVARGYPVALTNYRLSLHETQGQPPQVQHPMHVQDSLEALEFLARDPPKKNVYDPCRLYLIGHSAGAHIATSLILDPVYACKTHAYVRGVVGAEGIYDLPLLLETFPSYDFVPQAFGSDASTYAAASPVALTPSLSPIPPVLVVHSLEDSLVNLEQAQAMVRHLQQIGANVRLDTSVKGNHYGMLNTSIFYDLVARFVRDT